MFTLVALATSGFSLPPLGPRASPRCAAPRASASTSTWAEFNCGTWVGYAVSVDPITSEPQPAYRSTRVTVTKPVGGTVDITSVVGDGDDQQRCVDAVSLTDVSLDVDLDGAPGPFVRSLCSRPRRPARRARPPRHTRPPRPALGRLVTGTYSAQHDGQLQHVALMGGAALASGRVIEHSVAVSDDSRRRCLLAYSESGLLERVVVVVETKDGRTPSETVAPCTLLALVGEWRGDASVRALLRSISRPQHYHSTCDGHTRSISCSQVRRYTPATSAPLRGGGFGGASRGGAKGA
eukprot:672303-Prymnesium_polylepis.1